MIVGDGSFFQNSLQTVIGNSNMRKLILPFIICTITNGLFVSERIQEKMFTQVTGVVNFVFRMEEEKPIHEDVTFHLYTRNNLNRGTDLLLNNKRKLLKSHFKQQLATVFIIHGYTDHKERDVIIDLRRVLLDKFEINVIVVDWKRLAGFIYFNAASHACQVGRYLAKFLQFLELHDVDLLKVHLIGHSLGAQISGIAGDILHGRIGRITGLDPAGPLFEFIISRNSSETLGFKDAVFVDVIHTAGNDFGVMFPAGHADFYPNYGTSPQPGCSGIFTAISCSHIRSVEYFIESINGTVPFLAKQCSSLTDNLPDDCESNYAMPMGYFTPSHARGIFYLQTNPEPPFAMGKIH